MHAWLYALPPLSFIILLGIMWWCDKLPSIQTLHGLAEIANTKGGIILLLYGMSFAFFFSAMRYLYWIISRAADGKITVADGLITAGFAFITGAAFGGANGAMLKTMTGDSTIGTVSKETTEKTTVNSTATDKQQ